MTRYYHPGIPDDTIITDSGGIRSYRVSDQTPLAFFVEVAKGNVPGHSIIHKFGRNSDIDLASGFEAVWNAGGEYTGFPAAAEELELLSSSADDTAAGTGARTVSIQFLADAGLNNMPDVTVTLNGTAPVSLGAQTYKRGFRIKVLSAGSGGANAGTLTLRQKVTTANVFASVPVGYNATMIAAYTIPAGHRAYLLYWFTSLSRKKEGFSNARLLLRPNGEVFQVNEEFTMTSVGSSYISRRYEAPKNSILAKTDIVIKADSSVNDMGVSAGFDLLLIEDGS